MNIFQAKKQQPFLSFHDRIMCALSNVQEEDAQENELKIESERKNVKEARDELKNHEKGLMDINQKYKDVKNKMEQLSDETEQLKVRAPSAHHHNT